MASVLGFGVGISSRAAQKLHAWLLVHRLLNAKQKPTRKKETVIFPLAAELSGKEKKELKKKFPNSKLVKAEFESVFFKPASLKETLKDFLTSDEMEKLVSGFDSLGTIAIIEVPKELEKKEKLIANAVLQSNANFKTVCKKTGAHRGRFRIEPVKILAGKKSLAADYRESGCRFRVSIGKVFFSPRLSMERLRIAKLIRPDEVVGAFFAGSGPFPIVFAKNSGMKKAIAIELNPAAVSDMKFNIKLNKLEGKIVPVLGDVNKIVPKKYRGTFDRVVMPIPKSSDSFLKAALQGIKRSGGFVHFYSFAEAANPFEPIRKIIRDVAKKNGFFVRFDFERQVRTFSRDTVQIVVDFWAKKQTEKSFHGNRHGTDSDYQNGLPQNRARKSRAAHQKNPGILYQNRARKKSQIQKPANAGEVRKQFPKREKGRG
ncbi:MAG: class I SAM-dependent methyltransferase family protein [Candidatus Micrarchaeota archaeon]